ncbi:class I SAM-dependent methyltransferase [Pokkaliibacter plantistimulans]|nr:class I SAM-dependent methyltransferase [Pokkaliibacter plantistimulans]
MNQRAKESVAIPTMTFLGVDRPAAIKDTLLLGMTDRSYLPKAEDPRSDWVASVAAPSFRLLARQGIRVENFCTIGTGTGLDALAAIEIFRPAKVGITDIHADVIEQAQHNILENTLPDYPLHLLAGTGDLLSPMTRSDVSFDLIYENLPNIPADEELRLEEGQNSSTFIASREEALPAFVSQYLISLHYLAIEQAYPLLNHGGRVLSSIGARIPLDIILKLSRSLGYDSSLLLYTWKVQSEPEDVIGGYAAWEKQGLGPFRFYPVKALHNAFGPRAYVDGTDDAREIDHYLSYYELSAVEAYEALRAGQSIGHTVAMLESVKP